MSPWVFDADGHVVEPASTWETHLPARYRSYAPRVLADDDHFRFICNDRVSFRIRGRADTLAAPGQTPHKAAVPQAAAGAVDARPVSPTWTSTPSRSPPCIPPTG